MSVHGARRHSRAVVRHAALGARRDGREEAKRFVPEGPLISTRGPQCKGRHVHDGIEVRHLPMNAGVERVHARWEAHVDLSLEARVDADVHPARLPSATALKTTARDARAHPKRRHRRPRKHDRLPDDAAPQPGPDRSLSSVFPVFRRLVHRLSVQFSVLLVCI